MRSLQMIQNVMLQMIQNVMKKKKCNVTVICFYPPCFDTFGIDRQKLITFSDVTNGVSFRKYLIKKR